VAEHLQEILAIFLSYGLEVHSVMAQQRCYQA